MQFGGDRPQIGDNSVLGNRPQIGDNPVELGDGPAQFISDPVQLSDTSEHVRINETIRAPSEHNDYPIEETNPAEEDTSNQEEDYVRSDDL